MEKLEPNTHHTKKEKSKAQDSSLWNTKQCFQTRQNEWAQLQRGNYISLRQQKQQESCGLSKTTTFIVAFFLNQTIVQEIECVFSIFNLALQDRDLCLRVILPLKKGMDMLRRFFLRETHQNWFLASFFFLILVPSLWNLLSKYERIWVPFFLFLQNKHWVYLFTWCVHAIIDLLI